MKLNNKLATLALCLLVIAPVEARKKYLLFGQNSTTTQNFWDEYFNKKATEKSLNDVFEGLSVDDKKEVKEYYEDRSELLKTADQKTQENPTPKGDSTWKSTAVKLGKYGLIGAGVVTTAYLATKSVKAYDRNMSFLANVKGQAKSAFSRDGVKTVGADAKFAVNAVKGGAQVSYQAIKYAVTNPKAVYASMIEKASNGLGALKGGFGSLVSKVKSIRK